MLNRPPQWMITVAAVAVLSGCAGETGTATVPSQSGYGSTSPTSAGPTSAAPPTTGAPTGRPKTRTVVEIRSALLKLTDLPSGFVVEPANVDGVDIGAASSRNPKCAPLVKLSNAKTAPGSMAATNVTFSGGPSGPFIDESIDALGSADAVQALQSSLRSAVAACRQLTVTVPGQSAFTMKIVEVPAPKFGDHTFATRMTVAGGLMNGLEITQVTAGVKDVALSITFVAPTPQDVDGGTMAAVSKAEVVLSGAKAGG